MSVTDRQSDAVLRHLAVLAAAAMMMSLLPLAGTAFGQGAPGDPNDACPVEPDGQAPFTDRGDIPDAHQANVDCAYDFDIARGFTDNTYRGPVPVRRDQMAGFIARTLDAADVPLPAPADHDGFDDTAANTHEDDIRRLAAAEIVKGGPGSLSESSYGPALDTRRDQMASFLMRAAGYAFHGDPDFYEAEFSDTDPATFPDVPSTNTHFGNVEAAADNNIAAGRVDGNYQPAASTRRDQMASFLVRILSFLGQRPANVDVTPQAETGTVGVPETVTATATNVFDLPVETDTVVTFTFGESVTVVVPDGDPVTETLTAQATTDGNGDATVTFISAAESLTVTACVDNALAGGEDICDSEEFVFEAPATGAAQGALGLLPLGVLPAALPGLRRRLVGASAT